MFNLKNGRTYCSMLGISQLPPYLKYTFPNSSVYTSPHFSLKTLQIYKTSILSFSPHKVRDIKSRVCKPTDGGKKLSDVLEHRLSMKSIYKSQGKTSLSTDSIYRERGTILTLSNSLHHVEKTLIVVPFLL